MDASNPVQDSTRMTIAQIRDRASLYMKQDLAQLDALALGQPRIVLDKLPLKREDEVDLGRVVALVKEVKAERGHRINAETENTPDINLEAVLNKNDPIPVCALMKNGIPIHPAGKANAGGHAHATLSFGGAGLDDRLCAQLARIIPPEEVLELARNCPMYSRGSRIGLHKRITEQMGRPCKPSVDSYEHFAKMFARTMPHDPKGLVDWNTDLYDLVESVDTSYVSSAGAPYHRKKQDAVDDMLDVVLPLVAEAYCKKGGPDKLYKENPELFLCMVKNKDDRYENPILKTRPYVSLPWHFQVLFSVMCQSFCRSLRLFYQAKGCRNAYGFSYANGGGDRLFEFAKSLKPGEVAYCVYGDDVDLYYRNPKGLLMRICPDFKQMDGSVDAKTIRHVVMYIYNAFSAVHGENPFWKNVCEEWIRFATQPEFLMEGKAVWIKKCMDGLMTGVVGTTIFDTAKAIEAYEQFVELAKTKPSLLRPDNSDGPTKYFLEQHGLVIKEGTWNWEVVNENPSHGDCVTMQKFLGMRLKAVDYHGQLVMVPSLEYNEWMALLITPRRLEVTGHVSDITRQRYLFDRLRGYLTTGGAFDEQFLKVCNTLLDFVPAGAICMAVHGGEGKGTKPELVHVIGEDFNYSSSMGWPTEEWVKNLYASDVMKREENSTMTPVYTVGEDHFRAARKRPPLIPKAAIVDVVTASAGQEVVSSSVVILPDPEPPVVPVLEGITGVAEPATRSQDLAPNPKAKAANFVTATGDWVDTNYVPTLTDALIKIFNEEDMPLIKHLHECIVRLGGVKVYDDYSPQWLVEELRLAGSRYRDLTDVEIQVYMNAILSGLNRENPEGERFYATISPIYPLHDLARLLGQTIPRVEKAAREIGLLVNGSRHYKVVSRAPLAPMIPNYAEEQKGQIKENSDNLAAITKELKTAPIGPKTTERMKVKKSLLQSEVRAEKAPAMLPIPDEKSIAVPLPLKPITKYSVQDARLVTSFADVRNVALAVLAGSKYKYTHLVEMEGQDSTHIFCVNDVEVTRYKGVPKAAFYMFHKTVVDMYVAQSALDITVKSKGKTYTLPKATLPNETQTPWAELVEENEESMLRVYYYQGHPLLFQYPRLPVRLIADHPNLEPAQGGVLIRSEHQNNGTPILLSFKSDTIESAAARLNALLGGGVEGAIRSYSYIRQNHPHLISAYNLLTLSLPTRRSNRNRYKTGKTFEVFYPKGTSPSKFKQYAQEQKSKARKASKGGSKSGSRHRSQAQGGHKEQAERQQVVQQTPKAAAAALQYGKGRNTKREDRRVRLSCERCNCGERPSGFNQAVSQPEPVGVEWHPGPSGSQTLATVQTQVHGRRNHVFRLQNDGGAVRRGVDRRL